MESMFKTLVAACLLIIPAFAADTGTLRGIVHDPQHRPLPGAQIVLHGPGSNFTKTVTSDANGEFQLNDLPEGAYTIAVSAQGFQPAGAAGDRHCWQSAGSALSTRTRGR